MPCSESATVPLSESPLAFLSDTTIWTGLAKNSFWREIVFSKGTNISLEQLISFWNILLVSFMFENLKHFSILKTGFFSLFIQKYTFPRDCYYIITMYYPSLSVKYQWRYVLLSYIKISIYTFPTWSKRYFYQPYCAFPSSDSSRLALTGKMLIVSLKFLHPEKVCLRLQ